MVDFNDSLESDFARSVLSLAAETTPVGPRAFYNKDGDCIEFFISDESFYAERIDGLVTVYYGQESGEIVGSLIKGVKRFVEQMTKSSPGFVIEIEDGPVRLAHLFTAGMWKQGDSVMRKAYKKLRDAAEESSAEVELCLS